MPKRRTKTVAKPAAALRVVRAKGNALGVGQRSGASAQAAPKVDPRALRPSGRDQYGRTPAGPDLSAYGPPPEAFGGDLLPPQGAVAQSDTATQALAPRPIVDKFPVVIGAGLSFAYLAACQRTALTGYRMQYVDLAREILERDPHLYAVVWKVVLGIANGRLEITPAELPGGHPDEERAKEIAEDVERRFRRIRGLKQAIANLGWGAYYGVAAGELHYRLDDAGGWVIDRIGFIHSRRLSYPDMGTWDLYVWDQGQVLGASPYGTSPTNSAMFGLRVGDYPQKFVVFAPQMSGDYPTREGIARIVLEWALSKRLNARVALQYLERFVKPWPEASYNTADPDSERPGPRIATDLDIAEASNALNAMGAGALASWTHPDSVKVELKSPDQGRAKLTFKEFFEMCNDEESKGAVGGTLTTSVGQHGGGGLGSGAHGTHKTEENNVIAFYAGVMAEVVREQVVSPLTALNHKDAQHLVPQVKIHSEDKDPAQVLALAVDAAKNNIPVDADEIANEIGLPVIPKAAGVESRRMMPLDVTAPTDLNPELAPVPGPGTAAAAKAEQQAKAEQAKITAATRPQTTPPGVATHPTAPAVPPEGTTP